MDLVLRDRALAVFAASGSNLTFESREGFPRWARRASLRDARWKIALRFVGVFVVGSKLVQDRNAPQKHVWRAEIVLLTADGAGTNEGLCGELASPRPVFAALAGTLY